MKILKDSNYYLEMEVAEDTKENLMSSIDTWTEIVNNINRKKLGKPREQFETINEEYTSKDTELITEIEIFSDKLPGNLTIEYIEEERKETFSLNQLIKTIRNVDFQNIENMLSLPVDSLSGPQNVEGKISTLIGQKVFSCSKLVYYHKNTSGFVSGV